MDIIVKESLQKAMTYQEYRALINALQEESKTTGINQSEELSHYTMLNVVRMSRLDKTTKLTEDTLSIVNSIDKDLTFLIITEGWCGDAAQIIPVIEHIASQNSRLKTRYVLRDENLDLMNLYLTDGGMSIPKVIVIDEASDEVLTDWGPRPEEMQKMVYERKHSKNPMPYSEFSVLVQKWYAKDKTLSTQNEFTSCLKALV